MEDPESDLQGFISGPPDMSEITVAFRGTHSITDWSTNVDYSEVKWQIDRNCVVKPYTKAEVRVYVCSVV